MKQHKKSTFNLKTIQKPSKKSLSPAGKSKKTKAPKVKSEPAPKPKPKPETHIQHQAQLRYGPKIQSSGSSSISGTARQKTKSKRTTLQNQNLSQTQTKSKTKLKLKSRQTLAQNHNMSRSRTPHPKAQSGPRSSVWDTSVQAAIRVGDWKLLTGDPGHGDWVPVQVLPTLLGHWWNLERSVPSRDESSFPPQTVWLFNITADPYERQDLADQRPDVVQQLLARLAYYNQTAVPVYFPPNDLRADPKRHAGAWVPWADDEEEEEEEGKHPGADKKERSGKRKRRKKKSCRLCKLKTFFLKLNTGMMSNRI